MNKHYLLIGGINPIDENEKRYTTSQLANQAANSRWMWNLINGFEAKGIDLTVLNTPNIPSWQEDHTMLFHSGYSWSHNGIANDYTISFMNVFPFSLFFRYFAIIRFCRKWVRQKKGELVVIGITPHLPIVRTLSRISHIVKTCLIVPDLPDYTGKARMANPIYRLLKKKEVLLFYFWIRKIPYFVVLTDKMKQKLGSDKKFLRIECMVDPKLAFVDNNNNGGKGSGLNPFTILYSGTIHKHYGVYEVAHAISTSELNCRFLICGSGPGVEELLEIARRDNRIVYLGILNPDEVVSLQHKADALINPRPDDGSDYLQYSFPSKTLEYMVAAKPVICHKLPCIPREYDDYLLYIKDNAEESIVSFLTELMKKKKEELNSLGQRNMQFVVKNKNLFVQTERLINFLDS